MTTGNDEWRRYYELASFCKEQSGADGVIAVFLKGSQAHFGWHLAPELYPQIPNILDTAAEASFTKLASILEDPGVRLPAEVREQIRKLLKDHYKLNRHYAPQGH